MRKEDSNNPTPKEVILLDKEFRKIHETYTTTLQRSNVQQVNPCVNWEVEVLDVKGWVIEAIIRLSDPWSWLRGSEFDGKMSVTVRLRDDVPQEYLLKLNKGQRVSVEGPVRYLGRSFIIDPAKLVL